VAEVISATVETQQVLFADAVWRSRGKRTSAAVNIRKSWLSIPN